MDIYDVIVIGGGTSGCSCAWNCARLGLKTFLVEKENYLGGTMTGSLVVPVMNSGENQINTNFYQELIRRMKDRNAQITYQDNAGWFNPFILKDVLFEMLSSAGVNIMLNSTFSTDHAITLKQDNKNILSVCINKIYTDNSNVSSSTSPQALSVYIEAKYFVDATGNLDFSQNLNCRFLNSNSDFQPVSLRFVMSDINLKEFGNWLLEVDNDREVTTVEEIDGQTHLSTAYTWDSGKKWALAPYFDDAVNKNILKDSDRNYFQVFTVAGMPSGLAFNCPRILTKTNPYDEKSLKDAYNQGVETIYRLEKFCKTYFPGFKNAKIYEIAPKLGIRSGKRILGKYVYTIDDLRSGKEFENTALISNYPVDVHTRGKDTSILEKCAQYSLPVESLMSADYDNLYVIGRGLSADELAQGALRVQAACFSMGEAVACDIHTKLASSGGFGT